VLLLLPGLPLLLPLAQHQELLLLLLLLLLLKVATQALLLLPADLQRMSAAAGPLGTCSRDRWSKGGRASGKATAAQISRFLI
jgi:hypothetical protein